MKKPNRLEPAKLRSLIRATGRKGRSATAVWKANRPRATTAIVHSIQISLASNQAWLSPRSRNSWKAPMARLSRAKPMKSKGALIACLWSWMKVNTPRKAMIPKGRLM